MSPPGHGSPSLPEMPSPSTRGFVFPPYRRRVNSHDAWRVVPASEEFASAGLGSPNAATAQVPFLDALCTVSGPSNSREFVEGQQPRFGDHRQHRLQVRHGTVALSSAWGPGYLRGGREVFVLKVSRQRQCFLRDTKSSRIEDIGACSRLNIHARRCRLGWRPRSLGARPHEPFVPEIFHRP